MTQSKSWTHSYLADRCFLYNTLPFFPNSLSYSCSLGCTRFLEKLELKSLKVSTFLIIFLPNGSFFRFSLHSMKFYKCENKRSMLTFLTCR